MHNTVARLKPRSASFESAAKAFLSGDFSLCAEALSSSELPNAVALRARALLRMGKLADSLEVHAHFSLESLSHEYAAEILALKATGLVFTRDPKAESVLTEARARAFSSGFRPIECEVEFVGAQFAWTQGRISDALTAIEHVLEVSELPPFFCATQRTDYIYSVGYWRARALDLRGLIEAGSADYSAQAASLVVAFEEYDRGGVADQFIGTLMLTNLAYLVRDLDSEELATYVEMRAERQIWNSFSGNEEFVVFHAIGLNRARRGDHLGAFRALRRSATCAPSIPQQIRAILDRSFLARELGEVLSAQDDLEHAVRLAKSVDWEKSQGMQRSTLFELARILAPFDVSAASTLWNRYAKIKSSVSLDELAARGDRRQRADECSAHAAVLVAQSQTSRAITLLLESLDIWTEVGYSWRAAAVALDLAELTGEPRYAEIAAREAAKQPNSWLARRVATLKVPVPV